MTQPDMRLVPVETARHAANNMRIAFHKTRLTREVMVSPDDLSVVLDYVLNPATAHHQPQSAAREEAPSPAPSDEVAAWTWLNGHVECDPADVDYSADEMVDAFMAGQSFRTAKAAAREEAPEGARGLADAVMDALWPLLGGANEDADFWHEINAAVAAALRAQQPADDKLTIMKAGDVPVWSDGIVTDGERVALAQKAEADDGGTYWATDDGGDGALEWEPTHFIPLAALKAERKA